MSSEAPVTDWNTNPDLNGNLAGIPMYEGMPPNLLNDGVRAVMAAVFDEDVILRALIATNAAAITALQAAISLAGLTGMIADFPANVAPTNWLVTSGQLISRVGVNAALWAYAQASGCITADDATWLAGAATVQAGHFSPGDGSTTFRLMDPRGLFRRAWDNGAGVDPGRALGVIQAHGAQSHLHTLNDPNGVIASAAGASGGTGVNRVVAGSQINVSGVPITDGAHGVVTAGLSETRPSNVSFLTCIHL